MTQPKTKSKAKKPAAKKVTVKNSTAQGKPIGQKDQWADWTNEVAALSFELFFKNPQGQRWLQMMETRYFYSPVANPGIENNAVYWAFHTDGHNEFLRKVRALAQYAMAGQQKTTEPKKVTRKRTTK